MMTNKQAGERFKMFMRLAGWRYSDVARLCGDERGKQYSEVHLRLIACGQRKPGRVLADAFAAALTTHTGKKIDKHMVWPGLFKP